MKKREEKEKTEREISYILFLGIRQEGVRGNSA